MRVRALSDSGDMTFGQGALNYLVNSSAAVAQNVRTRLLLAQGEWFLDTTDGTPYATEILGPNTSSSYDAAIQARILDTPGVNKLIEYASSIDQRKLTVTCSIKTSFDEKPITITVSL